MKVFFRFLKCSVVAAAVALLSFNSSAHAAFYQGKVTQMMIVQASNGTIYLEFGLGGYNWGVPATDPSYAGYTAMVINAYQTQAPFTYVGCGSCTAVNITAPALTGTWTLWYPQIVEP
jgi:hypothetical protein